MHQLLSIERLSSSLQVITASLDGCRKITLTRHTRLKTDDSLHDLYAKRNTSERNYARISNTSCWQLPPLTTRARKGWKRKRDSPVIAKTYPRYSWNPKWPSCGLFRKHELLKYKQWVNSHSYTWADRECCDLRKKRLFLIDHTKYILLKNT